MLKRSWTRCRSGRSLGAVTTTTTLHSPDAVNPNADDVARYDFGAGTTGSALAAHDHVPAQAAAIYTPVP